ncbi:hypothetical protein Focb16_v011937 [Fusarium oxysporum f. sp. cubense]|uniref:Uncharacterized protein n=1 Tax=Fusarium oxysporum f. sp. cubense TaxID=61366 RepID=A0A559LEG9_FUSOC|nr:hypothetical protein Focb16_v011937 [Fusarium oxysporum f. sp. cubense]
MRAVTFACPLDPKNDVFQQPKTPEFDLTAMSWYSYVTHEVEQLTSGYRLVLPYKLFATGEDELWASIFFQQTKDLKSMLAKFRTDLPKVGKLLYPLDHLYTESSLCLRNLKGRDRFIGRYLNEICSEACFYFMFGQTTHFQVDIDDCDEYQDQTILRTLYNLNGDQLSSELVLNLEDFLDYDIGREVPDIENEGGLFGKAEEPRVFHYHKTVAYLMPKEYLHQLCSNRLSYRPSCTIKEDYFDRNGVSRSFEKPR